MLTLEGKIRSLGRAFTTWQEASAFLEALPIEKFFGVGRVTAAKLRERSIQTGADLKHMGEERLRDLFGKHGGDLYRYACGVDERPVEPVRERKSVGKEVTVERDIRTPQEMDTSWRLLHSRWSIA